jgi:uncharacterized coiled-coil protein SlyX
VREIAMAAARAGDNEAQQRITSLDATAVEQRQTIDSQAGTIGTLAADLATAQSTITSLEATVAKHTEDIAKNADAVGAIEAKP